MKNNSFPSFDDWLLKFWATNFIDSTVNYMFDVTAVLCSQAHIKQCLAALYLYWNAWLLIKLINCLKSFAFTHDTLNRKRKVWYTHVNRIKNLASSVLWWLYGKWMTKVYYNIEWQFSIHQHSCNFEFQLNGQFVLFLIIGLLIHHLCGRRLQPVLLQIAACVYSIKIKAESKLFLYLWWWF